MITLKELKSKIDKNARLIGLDLGKKRIGVSICDHTVSYTHLTLPTIYSV